MLADSPSYKVAKEAFVSDLEGTSLWEISLVTVTLSAGYLLNSVASVCLPAVRRLRERSIVFAFLLEYTTVVLPGVLLFTVLADCVPHVLTSLLLLSLTLVGYGLTRRGSNPTPPISDVLDTPYPRRSAFITLTRTYINLLTAIAILAVDFQIFPRRLAKTETYGTGLMDVGVGAFLLANAASAPEARHPEKRQIQPSLREYVGMLVLTGRYVLPLCALGLLRLAAVKSTDYQEHVTEYGVHWNFFFTVAVVRMLCTALHPLVLLIPRWPYALLSLTLALTHEGFLSLGGGRELVLWGPDADGSRAGFLAANREGIVSCLGYLVMYTGGIQVGRWLLRSRSTVREVIPLLLQLVAIDTVLWLLTYWSDVHVDRISRRFVNLSYMLWIFSYGFLMLAVFLAIDTLALTLSSLLHSSHSSPLYHTPQDQPRTDAGSHTTLQNTSTPSQYHICIVSAVDYNQLFFFVMANVLTGVVNLAVDTLHASAPFGLTVLTVYMLVLVGTFVLLHRCGVKVKL